MIINIPFQGFYETEISSKLDFELEMMIENDIYDSVNWQQTHNNIAVNYANSFLSEMGLTGKFVGLKSPKFYNFENDTIQVEFDKDELAKIKTMALEMYDDENDFEQYVSENCKSYDGFISFVDSNLLSWCDDWNEKQYCVALMFLDDLLDIEEKIIDSLSCNGGFEIVLND